MSRSRRTGFFYFILLFLARMPSVWLGGIGSAVAALALTEEFGLRVGAAGAAAVSAAAVATEFALDRRRGVGRRLLFRGGTLSARRLGALVVAMALIASMSTALAARFVSSIQDVVVEDVKSRDAPKKKR
jgi:hypothetical protein